MAASVTRKALLYVAVLVLNAPLVAESIRKTVLLEDIINSDIEGENSSVASQSYGAASVSACPCWNILSDLKPEECCYRTDKGSTSGEAAACAAHSTIRGKVQKRQHDCGGYCMVNCFKIAHPNDNQNFLNYLGEKMGEVTTLGPADILLARASWQAQLVSSGQEATYVDVKGIHALHPVGSWREDTWAKTEGRRDAVLAAKDLIVAAGGKLRKEDIDSTPALKPMRSVTNFIAVPFLFDGITHVLLEGNGRMKGLQLAQKEEDALKTLKVEVDLLSYSSSALVTVQEGILELWNLYVEEALVMDRNTEMDKFREYASFGIAVVKCMGTWEGLLSPRSECKVVNSQGGAVRTIPVGTLIGVQGKKAMPSGGVRYKLYPTPLMIRDDVENIGNDEYLVEGRDKGDMVAYEYCRKCVRPL